MTQTEKLVGKVLLHSLLGEVEVLRPVENSRTKVEIQVVQRAKGWDEDLQIYKRVQTVKPNRDINGALTGGVSIHRKVYNDSHSQFGHIDQCHIKELTQINNN
tara:strand:- start:41573 stop:41881 length:309 start_codon:yes stop_codon:yes gene_type:complete